MRLTAVLSIIFSMAGSGSWLRVASLSIGPGATAFTVIPCGPSSVARAKVSWFRASLLTPYTPDDM